MLSSTRFHNWWQRRRNRVRARRAAFLARRHELNAAIEARAAEVEATNDHPLYLALAEHCESAPWRDRLYITRIDWRDSWHRVRAER